MTQVSLRAKIASRFPWAHLFARIARNQHQAGRWLRVAILLFVCAIAALRFVHLEADFPNDSMWAIDQAKFTDEGWWAGGAVTCSRRVGSENVQINRKEVVHHVTGI